MLMTDTPEVQIKSFADNICKRNDVLYSAHNTTIATIDDEPVGMVTAYNGAEYKAMRTVTLGLLRELMGIEFPGMEDEAVAGEYYIDSLAVVLAHRGQGIGTALLKHAIATARKSADITSATLAVDPENHSARKLYESLGFRLRGDLFIFGHNYHKMILDV